MKWRNVTKTAEETLPLLTPGRILCVFDTETTGLGSNAKIIQFSGIRLKISPEYKFEEVDFLDLYINPEEKLDQKIKEITGITDELLAEAPAEKQVAPQIFRYLDAADVWAAYNSPFDLRMLDGMSNRTAISLEPHPSIDVLQFSRDWLEKGKDIESHSLTNTYSFLYPDGAIRFHKAIEDVKATISVMEALIPRYVDAIRNTEATPRKEVVVEKAYAWINPHNQKQQRICLRLTDGNMTSSGDIFYDYVGKCWSHKTTAKARKLFESIDLAAIEKRVLELCSNRYDTFTSIDQLAQKRLNWLRKHKQMK